MVILILTVIGPPLGCFGGVFFLSSIIRERGNKWSMEKHRPLGSLTMRVLPNALFRQSETVLTRDRARCCQVTLKTRCQVNILLTFQCLFELILYIMSRFLKHLLEDWRKVCVPYSQMWKSSKNDFF